MSLSIFGIKPNATAKDVADWTTGIKVQYPECYDNSYSGTDGLFLPGDIYCLNPQAYPVVLYLRVSPKVIIGIS